ncbi:hypothetical protein BIW11_06767 [Tropilaelaps mercedesae]|uniref:Uncharacterized protein n=1 Tax=Tropilaelaps mercedesae TaxID=418985 RepID=A0A1V9XX01_9ACAR|nr:hypothetical protein BIW11_06767 [Tropilaelaps mercedesae]
MWNIRRERQHLWAVLAVALCLLGTAKTDRSLHAEVGSKLGRAGLQADQSRGEVSGVQGAPVQDGLQTILLKVKIPESTEVVETEVARDSSIPDCVRKNPSTVDEDGGITVTAEVFTDCARKELRRIQDEFETAPANAPSSGPRGKSDETATPQDSKAQSATGTPSQGREIDQDSAQDSAQDSSKRQDKPSKGISDHERVNQGILAQHGVRVSFQ